MVNIEKRKKYNIAFMPFLVCFVFFCFIFAAVFNTGYFFEKQVLTVSSFCLVIWFVVFCIFEQKIEKPFLLTQFKLVVCLFSLFIGFCYIKLCFFSGYLSLNPVNLLFNQTVNRDTLYHSNIARSFSIFGLKGLFNGNVNHYHNLSHYFVSILARITKVPVFFVYNYLFHIVTVPLYFFILQNVVLEFRHFQNDFNDFSIVDFVFFIVFCLGFNFLRMANSASLWYESIFISESCVFSIIFLFLAFKLILKYYDKTIFSINFIKVFGVPFFIILISGGKISTGVIFYLFCCYLLFRNSPKSLETWIYIILYTIFLFIAYKLFSRSGELASGVYKWGASDLGNKQNYGKLQSFFEVFFKENLFDFARRYIKDDFRPFHYFFYLMPGLVIYKVTVHEKFLSKEYLMNKNNIWAESIIVLTILSFLPGVFMKIVGGSALYFVLPVYVISNMMILVFSIPSRFIECHKRVWKPLLLFLFLTLFYPSFVNMKIRSSISHTLKDANYITNVSGLKNKIKLYFGKSDFLADRQYKILDEVRLRIAGNAKDYCMTFMPDSFVSEYVASNFLDILIISYDELNHSLLKYEKKYVIIFDKDSYHIQEMN